jgi:hypothetical protein
MARKVRPALVEQVLQTEEVAVVASAAMALVRRMEAQAVLEL